MISFRNHRLLTVWMLMGLLLAGVQSFADEQLENRVRELSHKLRCPTCQAMSVKESEAGLSVNMKNKIREMLKEGKSEEEVLAFFEERYGEWILRSPKKEGFNLLLWTAPVVLILLATVVLLTALKARKRALAAPAEQGLSDRQLEKVDKDLERFDLD